ncbi:TSUP family transporter [Amycolatopsis sp. QT-25]|uniref:sulfite exporter TauE/SafE family protein n=1 Tax=Amycolatopsis sp. QT-25 TaxID=3034022 RepID=UPI0023EB1923|nr:TSUP family transporter [Amycolatopsis sp. QT-25]WET81841.1 TSUP family transporter [Amycolatopsis sp. QT-25]
MLTPLDWAGFGSVSFAGLLFLCVAAFVAGAVDAMVGGGGLIQLPALLLLMPGGSPVHALATNKISSLVGTSAAIPTYARRTPLDWPSALLMAVTALAGAVAGAMSATLLPPRLLTIIVLVALIGVGLYTLRQPDLGVAEQARFGKRRELLTMTGSGAVLGFWDGLAGPGTGSFLIFVLVGVIGYSFLRASATTKLVNAATNLGALLFFIPTGKVLWGLGSAMACCNLAGSVLGASVAARRGSKFMRRIFLSVVLALVCTLTWKLASGG